MQLFFVRARHAAFRFAQRFNQFDILREYFFHRLVNGERALETAALFEIADARAVFYEHASLVGRKLSEGKLD